MFIESENMEDLKAPEERNVLVIGGTLRSCGAKTTFFCFRFYRHFVPQGLKTSREWIHGFVVVRSLETAH